MPQSTKTIFITYLLYHYFICVHITLFLLKTIFTFYQSHICNANYYNLITDKFLQLFYTFPEQYRLNL